MTSNPYVFRRCDDGQIVLVDFATMMTQDRAGFITLPDGAEARRCVHLERYKRKQARAPKRAIPVPAVSDAIGFPVDALPQRRRQLEEFRCKGIEFKQDPLEPTFIQVHASSQKAMDRYAKRRNMVNRTGSLGGKIMLSQEDLDRAAELVGRRA